VWPLSTSCLPTPVTEADPQQAGSRQPAASGPEASTCFQAGPAPIAPQLPAGQKAQAMPRPAQPLLPPDPGSWMVDLTAGTAGHVQAPPATAITPLPCPAVAASAAAGPQRRQTALQPACKGSSAARTPSTSSDMSFLLNLRKLRKGKNSAVPGHAQAALLVEGSAQGGMTCQAGVTRVDVSLQEHQLQVPAHHQPMNMVTIPYC
jgi:hypothetical protein